MFLHTSHQTGIESSAAGHNNRFDKTDSPYHSADPPGNGRENPAGNIRGRASLPLLEKINQDDWVVMELSSWQLQAFRQAEISPQVSLVTSIFEDHLNRYPSMKAYLADKKAIFQSQAKDDLLFLNKDSALVRSFAQEAKSQIYWFGKEDFPAGWQLKLKGGHNRLNAAGAIKLTQALGIKWPVIKKAVEAFSGLPHRLETAAEINGIQYVNDSTSTTPAAGIAALNSFRKPIVLIAGGNSKKLAMEGFAREIVRKAKQVVFLEGDETDNLLNLVRKLGGREKIKGRFKDLKKAVYQARRLADLGEVILLSPGCTSFGTFANEFDRGEKFKKTVKEMEKD